MTELITKLKQAAEAAQKALYDEVCREFRVGSKVTYTWYSGNEVHGTVEAYGASFCNSTELLVRNDATKKTRRISAISTSLNLRHTESAGQR